MKQFVVMLILLSGGFCPPLWAYEVLPVERQIDFPDPDVVVTERFPMVTGLSDPAMAGTVNELLRYIYDQFYIEEEEEKGKRSLWVDYEILLGNDRFLSLRITASEYLKEAAHPMNHLEAITLDLKEGTVLALSDLFHYGSNYRQRINAFIRQQLSLRDDEGKPRIPLLCPFMGIEDQNPFFLTPGGVVVFFPEYRYTPHSWGPLEVEVPYSLLRDIMIVSPGEMGLSPGF